MRTSSSILSVLVLTAGMRVFILSGIYVSRESSADALYANVDRIAAVVSDTDVAFARKSRHTHRPLQTAIADQLPYVERVVQTPSRANGRATAREGDTETVLSSQNVLSATSAFFQVFTFDLQRGDPAEVLKKPSSGVTATDQAQTLFGDSNAIG